MTAPTDLPPDAPPDLEYRDPLQRVVDVDAVIRRARHARSRRRGLAAVAGLAAVVVVGGVSADRLRSHMVTPAVSHDPTSEVLAHQYGREHPPMTNVVVIDDSVRGWDIVGWISTSGEFCGGVLPTTGQKEYTMNCWVDTTGVTPGTQKVFGKPIFQDLPLPDPPMPVNVGDRALAIGAVAGDATHVDVVFRDKSVEAPVVPLATGGATRIGAYALWVRLKPGPADSYGWDDISTITARDSAGDVVAQLPDTH